MQFRTQEDNALARKLYEEVIALDPDYAAAESPPLTSLNRRGQRPNCKGPSEEGGRAGAQESSDLPFPRSAAILAGREEEARAAAVEVLKINPTFSLGQYARTLPYKDASQIDRTIDAPHKAGLK